MTLYGRGRGQDTNHDLGSFWAYSESRIYLLFAEVVSREDIVYFY